MQRPTAAGMQAGIAEHPDKLLWLQEMLVCRRCMGGLEMSHHMTETQGTILALLSVMAVHLCRATPLFLVTVCPLVHAELPIPMALQTEVPRQPGPT